MNNLHIITWYKLHNKLCRARCVVCRALLFDKLDIAKMHGLDMSNLSSRVMTRCDEPSGIWSIGSTCHVVTSPASGGSRNFERERAEDNVSAPSSFIAIKHNGKRWLIEKYLEANRGEANTLNLPVVCCKSRKVAATANSIHVIIREWNPGTQKPGGNPLVFKPKDQGLGAVKNPGLMGLIQP